MKDYKWVIDTEVLYKASNFQAPAKALQTHHFLTNIWKNPQQKVAVDSEGKIEAEYQRCFGNPRSEFQCQWWIHIKWIARKVVSYSGRLSTKHANYLTQHLHFDDDDLPFVGVASKTRDKFLVAEESDYTAEVQGYLRNELGIRVMSIAEADDVTSQSV